MQWYYILFLLNLNIYLLPNWLYYDESFKLLNYKYTVQLIEPLIQLVNTYLPWLVAGPVRFQKPPYLLFSRWINFYGRFFILLHTVRISHGVRRDFRGETQSRHLSRRSNVQKITESLHTQLVDRDFIRVVVPSLNPGPCGHHTSTGIEVDGRVRGLNGSLVNPETVRTVGIGLA